MTQDSLSRAYQLIEAEKLAEARSILEPILAREPNNADVWWVYAHAVEDVGEAERALDKVTQIKADYPGAAELKQQLYEQTGRVTPADEDIDSLFDDLDEDDVDVDAMLDSDEFDEFDEIDQPEKQSGRRTLLMRLAFVGIIVLLAVIALGILLTGNRDGGDDDLTSTPDSVAQIPTFTAIPFDPVEPTEAAGEPSAEATDEVEATPTAGEVTIQQTATQEILPDETEEATEETGDIVTPVATLEAEITEEATQASADVVTPDSTQEIEVTVEATEEAETTEEPIPAEVDTLISSLSAFNLASDVSEIRQTDLGQTVLVGVCAENTPDIRGLLNDAMFTLAGQAASVTDSDAIGIRLQNCEVNRVINIIAFAVTDGVDFSAGTLSESQFIARWRAVGEQ